MKQQYILLRKENDSLNSLIGESFNQKTKFEAEKILDEIHCKAESRMIGKKALCYIVDNLEIKGVGGSTLLKHKKTEKIISNLILDQFGIFLAQFFGRITTGSRNVTIKDFLGVNQTVGVYRTAQSFNVLSNVGIFVKVGSGSTVPARTDFKIETSFGTTPEDVGFVATSDPVFSSGLGNLKYAAIITAGGSGTINESTLGSQWQNIFAVAKGFTLFRDIISPSQAFIAGQTIALEYTVQL